MPNVIDIMDKYGIKENWNPNEAERNFVSEAYNDLIRCANLKTEAQDQLGGMTLDEFWDKCEYDYNVLVEQQDADDPIVPYSSSVSRDKANIFITNLATQMMMPNVVAQNPSQQVDLTISRIARSLFEWANNNDGAPAESGQQKNARYVHTLVISGTVHVQDDVVDGKLISNLVPNKEIYIPSFKQPNIQLQPYIFRVKENVLYEEAKMEFGDLPNFAYVIPGASDNWVVQPTEAIGEIIEEDQVQITYTWRDIPRSLFKNFGIPKSRKAAKLFNVIINGVLMFKTSNLMPYHDGFYPISKGIFESFADAEYYWGNSAVNKMSQDKNWKDAWKTMIRYKGKMAALPPLVTFNGQFVDADFTIPGTINAAPAGMKHDDIQAIPGITSGPSNADFNIMTMTDKEIEQGSMSPQSAGAESSSAQTAREALIREENAQRILGGFGMQLGFLAVSRAYPIIRRLFQFIPRQKIEKISVPDQILPDGSIGTMEIRFGKMEPMSEEQLLSASNGVLTEEAQAKAAGNNKRIIYLDPGVLKDTDLYLTPISEVQLKKSTLSRLAEEQRKFDLYASDPEVFNKRAAARKLVRALGDDEAEMINQQAVNPAMDMSAALAGPKKTGSRGTAAEAPIPALPELNM